MLAAVERGELSVAHLRNFQKLRKESEFWAAAGFKDTLLRWSMKPEVVYGDEKEIQPRVQA